MPHHVVQDDFFFNLIVDNSTPVPSYPRRQQECSFFSDLDLEKSDPVKSSDKPPRLPLRSLVSKAFVTTCKDKTLYRARSFPFLKDAVSPDKTSLLGGDQLMQPFNFEDGSDTTADLVSESSTTPPYTVPLEQMRLKKHLKEWRSRMGRSFKSIVAKRQYRTMADQLFDGIEVPLHDHELMSRWDKAYQSTRREGRDEVPTLRGMVEQEGWPSIHPPSTVNFGALGSPSLSTLSTEAEGARASPRKKNKPIMTVCYEDQCAQLVFRKQPILDEDEEERPFDEYMAVNDIRERVTSPSDEDESQLERPPSSPSDEDESQLERPPSSSPGKPLGVVFAHPSWVKRQAEEAKVERQAEEAKIEHQPELPPITSPEKPLGVAFSHPSYLKRQAAEQKDEYGDLWETLGDSDMDGDVCQQIAYSRNLFPSARRDHEDQASYHSALSHTCLDDFPFDEIVADDVVGRDPSGNTLGVEITANFSQSVKQSSRRVEKRVQPAVKKRPVCNCIKCSADLYPVAAGK